MMEKEAAAGRDFFKKVKMVGFWILRESEVGLFEGMLHLKEGTELGFREDEDGSLRRREERDWVRVGSRRGPEAAKVGILGFREDEDGSRRRREERDWVRVELRMGPEEAKVGIFQSVPSRSLSQPV